MELNWQANNKVLTLINWCTKMTQSGFGSAELRSFAQDVLDRFWAGKLVYNDYNHLTAKLEALIDDWYDGKTTA